MALSPQQQKIADHPFDRHALVLAVAGSGKSTTMVERIGRLVEVGRFDPTRVTAVMFNTDAAQEFGEKLVKRLGKRNAPESRTFHGLGTSTLRKLVLGGFAEQWSFIGEPSKAERFTAEIIHSVCLKHGHKYPRRVARDFLSFVDRVKSDLLPPSQVWAKGNWASSYDWFVSWYNQFEKERYQRKVRFFSDLIYDPVRIMMQNPQAAEHVNNSYDHIIVDEYQDIAESQQRLVRFNAGTTAKVMAVGDDDQTIYGWRGAKASYILRDFHLDFPGGTSYLLDRTWRYGHVLSCAANYVISGNDDRADKLCVSGGGAPDTKIFLEYDIPALGKPKIVSIVDKWRAGGRSLSEMVVLVRAYSKSASTQFDLLQHGVPFRLEGGDEASVLQNKWVATLIGWMQLAAGQIAVNAYAGEPDLGSIIDTQKFVNVPSLGLTWENTGILAKMALQHPDEGLGFSKFASQYCTTSQALTDRVKKRGNLWRRLRGIAKARTYPKAAILAGELLYFLDIENSIKAEVSKPEDRDEILALIEAFVDYVKLNSKGKSLPEFMNHVQDLLDTSEKAKNSTTALLITSCHRSKGMEWPCVIMPNLYQGSFPLVPRSLNGISKEQHLEDERRLFYVAMTRAINELYWISPADPRLHQWLRACKGGNCNDVIEFAKDVSTASQFLYESNLYLSKALPLILSGGKGKESLMASSPELINRYLQELKVDFQIPKIT